MSPTSLSPLSVFCAEVPTLHWFKLHTEPGSASKLVVILLSMVTYVHNSDLVNQSETFPFQFLQIWNVCQIIVKWWSQNTYNLNYYSGLIDIYQCHLHDQPCRNWLIFLNNMSFSSKSNLKLKVKCYGKTNFRSVVFLCFIYHMPTLISKIVFNEGDQHPCSRLPGEISINKYHLAGSWVWKCHFP